MEDQVVETTETTETPTPDTQIDIAVLQKELESARNEAAKYRNIKNQAVEELAKLKESKPTSEKTDDYKQLYQQEKEAREAIEHKLKSESLDNALRSKLAQKGITSAKAIDAAIKLLDKSLIDGAEDEVGLDAATIKLRKEYDFLFEQKVTSPNPKMPANKSGDDINSKEITRDDFFSKPPNKQAELMKAGYIVI